MTTQEQQAPNEAAEEAFKTIQVIFDHQQHNATPGPFAAQKFVLSEQTVEGALAALVNYYGEPHVLASEGGLAVIRMADTFDDFAFVYTNRENSQAIMSTDTWAALVQANGGSMSAAVDMINHAVSTSLTHDVKQFGSMAPLKVLGFDVGAPDSLED